MFVDQNQTDQLRLRLQSKPWMKSNPKLSRQERSCHPLLYQMEFSKPQRRLNKVIATALPLVQQNIILFFVFWHCSNIAAAANLVSSLVLLCMSCPTINNADISASVLPGMFFFFSNVCFVSSSQIQELVTFRDFISCVLGFSEVIQITVDGAAFPAKGKL